MKYIIANWKMNKTLDEANDFIRSLRTVIDKDKNLHILIAPPIIYLPILSKSFKGIDFVAQNVSFQEFGAYTGEVSANMLQPYIHYSLIGHSERRQYFNEDNITLYEKILMCLKHDIQPILCVGESKNERDSGEYFSLIKKQLKETVLLLKDSDLLKIMIAYEPVWAIGTGKTASSNQISEVHNHIREILINRLGDVKANEIPILYGGSCSSSNTSSVLVQKNVDGLLVGGASLDVEHFKNMIDIAYSLSF
jgi:triosephosphate isomerase